jgi:beta-galactosidase
MSRRALLRTLALGRIAPSQVPGSRRGGAVNASRPLNDGWLFGEYQPGAEAAGFDDRDLCPVTLPHCTVRLPMSYWDPASWERRWIYRRHFRGLPSPLLLPPGGRVFADFDGVMTDATVVCNDQVVAGHLGGYLPFSAELTGCVTNGGNALSVIVDSRWLGVPRSYRASRRMASTSPSRAASTAMSPSG